MNADIQKALYNGEYICKNCANEDKLIKLFALTDRKRVWSCPKCLLSYSCTTLDKWIDTVDELSES